MFYNIMTTATVMFYNSKNLWKNLVYKKAEKKMKKIQHKFQRIYDEKCIHGYIRKICFKLLAEKCSCRETPLKGRFCLTTFEFPNLVLFKFKGFVFFSFFPRVFLFFLIKCKRKERGYPGPGLERAVSLTGLDDRSRLFATYYTCLNIIKLNCADSFVMTRGISEGTSPMKRRG